MLQSREKLLPCPPRPLMVDRRWKTTVEVAPNCPRCNSSNTKFCYYNNYSLTQPRYFCKGCRRYWTKGGSLRNVPVGGGCRKNRRGKSLRVSSSDHINIHGRSSSVDVPAGGGAGYGTRGCVFDNSDSTGSFSHSSGDVGGSSSSADASTIDLAVVYAKFLNQQPANVDPARAQLTEQFDGGAASFELSSNGSSNHPGHHSPVQFSGDHSINMAAECSFDGLSDAAAAASHLTHHEYDPQFPTELDAAANPSVGALPQHERVELQVDDQMITTLTNYYTGSTLQSIAPSSTTTDDTGCFGIEDSLWSSCLMEPNFTPDQHPQGLESMIQDHHLPLQPSFFNGNWTNTSFDYLSSCDAFTRP